ncbi:uncharacterized protein N7503_006791 [Penicillium pulvis]|uniref:uncharacterized protein n=1 Tax=Penicillium pulvis TaxID=1562058 RepID=UPI002548CE5C|nr:uncharacterized protein N7503_006791 [Penicillium pulvis]KAJ5797495.1 hypothetical protein N7503_006791 [Penicillium pulvis]
MVALVDRRLHETAASILFRFFCLTIKSGVPKKWEYYSNVPWRYVKVIVVAVLIGFTPMFLCISLEEMCVYHSEDDHINPLNRPSLTFGAFAIFPRIGMASGTSYPKLSRVQAIKLA